MNDTRKQQILAIGLIAVMSAPLARAQEADQAAELAKKLANPVASLVSVPLQYNYDDNFGAEDKGSKSVLIVQPVIPFSLNEDWNLITRTIVPFASVEDIPPGNDKSGLGDITQSFFFSPKEPIGGWILAAGPVGLYPSGDSDGLGGRKWGAGPTALALKQTGPWTYGMLANHIESFAGDDEKADISTTFIQPFLSYVTKTQTTVGLNAESTYDWENEQWQVPVNATVSQLVKIGSQMVQLTLGARYWAESGDNGPEDWGLRAGVTFLYPK